MTLKEILQKIGEKHGVTELNPMQKAVGGAKSERVILLAPTGSGKTLAFAVPLISRLRQRDNADAFVQAVIMAPSRELVIQIADVIRPVAFGDGNGFKTVALYGGHSMQEEVNSLTVVPDIIVATPGRLLDHINRGTVDVTRANALVLDEYDKALELGFHDQMRRIVKRMRSMRYVTLTSATAAVELPDFIDMSQAKRIDYSSKSESPRSRTVVTIARSENKDKLAALATLLCAIPHGKTIVFVNHRESAERTHAFLKKAGFPAGLYHGGLDQLQRELAIDMLNNGTTPVLVSTDLGSRGLDIDAVLNVVHYHIPPTQESWTHRNGRTARVDADGNVYMLLSKAETVPDYVDYDQEIDIEEGSELATGYPASEAATIYFNVGKKEKISKADVLGFLSKQSGLASGEVGKIVVKDHCAIAAVPRLKADEVLLSVANAKIKGQRVKITMYQ